MAIIQQKPIFGWDEIEKSGELFQLELVLKHLSDESLMKLLETNRKKGRNKYPIRCMWNAFITGILLGHRTTESLLRELRRNPLVANICGFYCYNYKNVIPTSSAFSRFIKLLMKYSFEVHQIFESLVNELYKIIPDFGENLAIDGKSIPSYANKNSKRQDDHRGDYDADWGAHKYSGIDSNGKYWEKIKSWFGYKLHLLVDSKYELPISFMLAKASKNEIPIAHKVIDNLSEKKLEKAKYLCADRGLDDGKLIEKLWDSHNIKPIIDIRNLWKGPDNTKLLKDTDNIVYDFKGTVSCMCPIKGKQYEMAFGGFEQDRSTLKYRCPATHYGWECIGKSECSSRSGIRIPLKTDRRIFTPVARSSYKWKTQYNKRSAVERVNSRIDNIYGFENHTMRGQKKIGLRLSITFMVMTALAVGWVREGKQENIRKLKTAG